MTRDRFLNGDRGFFATQGESHEVRNHFSIARRRLRGHEHHGSKRRRLRSGCIPGGLRRSRRRGSGTPRCRSCCRRATARGRSTAQSVLIVVRRIRSKHVSARWGVTACLPTGIHTGGSARIDTLKTAAAAIRRGGWSETT
jgi:hypothetical protein